VDTTSVVLIRALVDRTPVADVAPRVRRPLRVRALATLGRFGLAAVVALTDPPGGCGRCGHAGEPGDAPSPSTARRSAAG
jgi:hypothetical protein